MRQQRPISDEQTTGEPLPSPIVCERELELLERVDLARSNGTWLGRWYAEDVEYLLDRLRMVYAEAERVYLDRR